MNGILPCIVGAIYLSLGATIVALPVGVASEEVIYRVEGEIARHGNDFFYPEKAE